MRFNQEEENKIKLTVLADNNTLIDRYFLAEPGLSFYIETNDYKMLFDAGYSNVYLINAQKAKIDLLDLDFFVVSHGHMDHTWGFPHLIRLKTEASLEEQAYRKATLLSHPNTFLPKWIPEIGPIGAMIPLDVLKYHFFLNLSKEPIWLNKNIVFLGEIPRRFSFEAKNPIGKTMFQGKEQDDFLFDDSAMVIRVAEGLVVITGCSHAGICNIVEYARQVCQEDRIYDIIGGFHLLDPPKDQLRKTMSYFKKLGLSRVHACHCIDLSSKIALSKVCSIEEVGTGMTIEYIERCKITKA